MSLWHWGRCPVDLTVTLLAHVTVSKHHEPSVAPEHYHATGGWLFKCMNWTTACFSGLSGLDVTSYYCMLLLHCEMWYSIVNNKDFCTWNKLSSFFRNIVRLLFKANVWNLYTLLEFMLAMLLREQFKQTEALKLLTALSQFNLFDKVDVWSYVKLRLYCLLYSVISSNWFKSFFSQWFGKVS